MSELAIHVSKIPVRNVHMSVSVKLSEYFEYYDTLYTTKQKSLRFFLDEHYSIILTFTQNNNKTTVQRLNSQLLYEKEIQNPNCIWKLLSLNQNNSK